jgi:hypothetical protein
MTLTRVMGWGWENMGLFHFRNWAGRGVSVTPDQLIAHWKALEPEDMGYPRDSKYRAISNDDFMELVEKYRNDDGDYEANRRDCDKYAVFFQADILRAWADICDSYEALAFGYVSGTIIDDDGKQGGHAWIWQLDDKGVIQYIQAQSNKPMTWKVVSVDWIEG